MSVIEDFATFMDGLRDVGDLPQGRRLAGRLAMALGLPRSMIYRTVDDAATGVPLPVQFDTDLDGFHLYLSSGVYRRDPFILPGLDARRPLLTPFERLQWAARTPVEAEVFEDFVTREATFRMAIPGAAGPGGVRWTAAYSSPERVDLRHAGRAASLLWLATSALGERLLQIEAGPDAPLPEIRLDAPAREALLRLAGGQAEGEVAARLGLTEAAISAMLARVGRSIGARSGPELVGRALARGLVEP